MVHIASLLALLPSLVFAVDTDLHTCVNFVYGNSGGAKVAHPPSYVMEQFDMFDTPPSAVQPFMLNNDDLMPFKDLIDYFTEKGTKIYPAIGSKSYPLYNMDTYLKYAAAYSTFTDRIQLTNMQGYIDNDESGIDDINNVINYLTDTLNFTHIQLNPWPKNKDRSLGLQTFSNPAVDSSVNQVQLKLLPPNRTGGLGNAKTNWTPNPVAINRILDLPDVQIIVNYENAPEEQALEKLNTSDQLTAMRKTVHNISESYGYTDRVHWTPPWSQNYDPTTNGTWGYIVQQFNQGNP